MVKIKELKPFFCWLIKAKKATHPTAGEMYRDYKSVKKDFETIPFYARDEYEIKKVKVDTYRKKKKQS